MKNTLPIPKAIEVFKRAKRPFVGELIAPKEEPGECKYCAQGLILNACGMSDDDMHRISQRKADIEVAEILSVSLSESVLLRIVNDGGQGLPQAVLILTDQGIGSVLGTAWRKVVSFWRHIDSLDEFSRTTLSDTAYDFLPEWCQSRKVIAASQAAWFAAGDLAEYATVEIMAAPKPGKYFYLPKFGFATPDDIPMIDFGAA